MNQRMPDTSFRKCLYRFKYVLMALPLVAVIGVLVYLLNERNKSISSLNWEVDNLRNRLEDAEGTVSQLRDEKEELADEMAAQRDAANEQIRQAEATTTAFSAYGVSNGNEPVAVVAGRRQGCDYMILEDSRGYIIAEWMGGYDPALGDRLYGNFRSYGTKSYATQNNRESRLYIEDYWLSKSSAIEKINDKCD